MNRQRLALILLIVLLAIPTTVFAANYHFVQGFATRKGAGEASQHWFANKDGLAQTDTHVKRIVGNGLTSTTESWANAMVCKSIVPKKGIYKVTAYVPLNGKLTTERYIIGRNVRADASISTIMKIWQGTYSNTPDHKFTQLAGSVSTNHGSHGAKDTTIKVLSEQTVNYPVSIANVPLKICAGRESYSKVTGYGQANSYFVDGYGGSPLIKLVITYIP